MKAIARIVAGAAMVALLGVAASPVASQTAAPNIARHR
jgi:hypothetical protein